MNWLSRDTRLSCPTCRGQIRLTEEQKTMLLLNRFSIEELNAIKTMMLLFVDSVIVHYEYNIRKIPPLESIIIPNLKTSLDIINEIIQLKKSVIVTSLKHILRRNKIGFLQFQSRLNLQYDNLMDSIRLLKNYKERRITSYRSAQMGIDLDGPIIHPYTGMPDYIARPARTERGRVMTRRVRSY